MFDGISLASRLAKAVAFAEGCIDRNENYHKLSLPYRLNNPCDLKVTNSQFTHYTHHSGKLLFVDLSTGWNAGAFQMDLMLTNKSHVYNNKMSIQEVANHYAKEHSTPLQQIAADNWAKNVALFLSRPGCEVTPTTTLIELMNIPLGGMLPVFPSSQAEMQQMEQHNEVVEKNEEQIMNDVSKATPVTTKNSLADKLKNKKGD
jgi:hypothetical protein